MNTRKAAETCGARHAVRDGYLSGKLGVMIGTAVILLTATTVAQQLPKGPVAAEETLAHFELHPDCRIELVAAEPDVIDPVAIAFDPDGKLWVVEYSDYPNGPPENGPPLSRIRTLTDADGDGRYTDAVTFADKLLFANGLMLWQDGVIVTMDGSVTFMRDLDGDGAADEQTEWFRGFAKENPQLRANHPTLGLDGHIYVASGLRGGEVIAVPEDWAQDAQPVPLSGRDFRFDPFTGKYEAVSGPSQFGLCFDPFGNRFGCSNRNPCKHYVLEDRYLARNPFLAVKQVHEDVSPAAENSRLYPISRTWTTSNLHANQFTAACGLLIYGGDALPQFRGNSFICEPTGNLVHRDVLTPKGATFTSTYGREGVEFLATRDEWFRPVNLKHGPDGALYVVDMYRAVIEHPQFMPDELKTRPDLTLGNDRGRIYRIVARDSVNRTHDSSFRTDPEQLVKHLKSPNAWHRETAFRLLLTADAAVTPLLAGSIQEDLTPESMVAVTAVLLARNGVNREDVERILEYRDQRVAATLIGLSEAGPGITAGLRREHAGKYESLLFDVLRSSDVEPHVEFQAVFSAGSVPPPQERHAPEFDRKSRSLSRSLSRNATDAWFSSAVAASAAESEAEVLLLALDGLSFRLPVERSAELSAWLDATEQFAQIVSSRGDELGVRWLLARVLYPLESSDPHAVEQWQRIQFALLTALADGARRGKLPLTMITEAERADVVLKHARDWVTKSGVDAAVREEAIAVVAIDPAVEATHVLVGIVQNERDQRVLTAAIAALARKSDERIADVLLNGFKARTPSVRTAILNAMLARTDRISRLLDEIEAGNLSPRDIDAATAARLTKSRDAAIKERARKLLAAGVDENRAKVIAAYEPCLSQPGNPQRGFEVFKKICATCHKVGDVGTNVGPDISDSRTKTAEFLLTNILDPNRAVDGNYFGYTILDTEGRVHTGIITAETASSVTLRIQEGKNLTLLRQDIEEMTNTGLSLMPVGVEKDITVEQMSDLISYIKNWRYLDGSVPQEVIGR